MNKAVFSVVIVYVLLNKGSSVSPFSSLFRVLVMSMRYRVRSNFRGTKFSRIAQKWHVRDFIFAVDQDFRENIILVILRIL